MKYRVCGGACGRRRQLKFFAGFRGRVCATCKRKTSRTTSRKSHLVKTYGVTPEEYALMLTAQRGVCGVCGGTRAYNLAVDHSHAVAEVVGVRDSIRGLLCKRCNKLLRDVRDDVNVLRGAIRYLVSPPAQAVLDTANRFAVKVTT